MNKTVDIIIPTYRPDEKFENLIDLLEQQSYPINHIIVINTEQKLFSSKNIDNYNNIIVEHIREKDFDHGGTRDSAALKSDADIIVFMTQDAIPDNEYLIENLIKGFESNDIGATYARQLPRENCGEIERFTRSFNYPNKSSVKSQTDINTLGIKTYFCSNVCAAYQKELYVSLGGFIKHTIFNEDMIFAGRIIKSGMKIAYCANARVIHSHNYTNLQQLRRNFDLAVSQKDNPDVFDGIKSEGEGIKLVIQTAKHCCRIGKPWLVFELVMKSGFKYIGYKLGLAYYKLPSWLIKKLTMNKEYWK
ncbi:MAG: glycosyltransferase family 2 protein [Lachnotalea sp.]